jgi:hypothetical protein
MAITVISMNPNPTVPPGVTQAGLHIFSGVIECLFFGDNSGDVTRDTLSFNVGPVNLGSGPPMASCIVSLASFAYDGAANNLLWAVDATNVGDYVNADRGSGTADLPVTANLAVRGLSGIILRVNYILFYTS